MKIRKILFPLLATTLLLPAGLIAQPKVIAHRGNWDHPGCAQNSIASLRKAAEAGCYGSEFDVNVTKDGIAVVNHDRTVGKINIEKNPYSAIKDSKLANGETLPTLKEYLAEGKKYPQMKLILEIKSASNQAAERRATDIIMKEVEEMGVQDQVEYIAFSLNVVKQVMKNDPKAFVAYLNGDLSPIDLKKIEIPGLDYNTNIMRQNPGWFQQAKKKGIHINVWTVDNPDDIRYMINNGVDYITTNKPELTQQLIKEAKE